MPAASLCQTTHADPWAMIICIYVIINANILILNVNVFVGFVVVVVVVGFVGFVYNNPKLAGSSGMIVS
jgi:hypothetical protein